MIRTVCLLLLLMCCAGCDLWGSSATSVLRTLADSLEKNDASAFLNSLDLKACAANDVRNLTEDNDVLNTVDRLGRNLGLGGVGELLDNVLDTERNLKQNFRRKVSTGELANECRRQETPNCPWVPRSLRQADVDEFRDGCAVARVTTPARVTTWLALVRQGKEWRVVGWAYLQDTARQYAEEAADGPRDAPEKKQPKVEKKRPRRDMGDMTL